MSLISFRHDKDESESSNFLIKISLTIISKSEIGSAFPWLVPLVDSVGAIGFRRTFYKNPEHFFITYAVFKRY